MPLIKNSFLISDYAFEHTIEGATIADKYEYLYTTKGKHLCHFERKFFGPFIDEKSDCIENLLLTQYDLVDLRHWIIDNIVIKFCSLDYKTLDVLIRIATGMLNKCDIPKEDKIFLHDNLVWNLRAEHNNLILSGLPF